MIHLPIYRHTRRFLASMVVFGSIVLVMLWLPVQVVRYIFPNFLPFHVMLSRLALSFVLTITMWAWGNPTPPYPFPSLPHLLLYLLISFNFSFSLSYSLHDPWLLLFHPSHSTRIVPVHFQAGCHRMRLNLALVLCVCVCWYCVICIFTQGCMLVFVVFGLVLSCGVIVVSPCCRS